MDKERKDKLVEKIVKHPVIEEIYRIFNDKDELKNTYSARNVNMTLIGGAVVDLLEGREPKDYDFVKLSASTEKILMEAGFKFQYETKTSRTFMKTYPYGDVIIQSLKNPSTGFDFTISQSRFSLSSKHLTLDEIAFENKILIPPNFEAAESAANSLARIPHWRDKGYEIPDKTYFSLLGAVTKYKYKHS